MKKFYLSSSDKKIGGVCGGLSEYFDIDPLIVRIAFAAFILSYGAGLVTYLLIWLLAPKNHQQW
ncbi:MULTISPECIES: PspC domain-containing protein [unclassified Prevotella]|jgi:phage shock protein PspC (stress-responsive transcriptional regulator)|uniref:PspC domain-containing protein n=1 Tax=unclassified Prevotella TaxID=2638335 RepID=UPI000CEA2C63|nr:MULTISPECIES: PspC domain-containing protein [unclassified Prevotella]NPD55319.1 PspC domain-containing protein [Prevotella sp. PTAC]GAY26760.1 pspC domain protein [Prevotella sp. MGM1]